MRTALKGALATTILLALVMPSLATPGHDLAVSHMPEIDGAAGISAIAVLASMAMLACNRLRA